MKTCSKDCKRKPFSQLHDQTMKIFRGFFRPLSKSSQTAAAKTNLLILVQERTWHAAWSHFLLLIAMHFWFPVEPNFSVLEIVSEFSFSVAPWMLYNTFNELLVIIARISCKETGKFFFTFLPVGSSYSLQSSVCLDSIVKNILCNICKCKAFGFLFLLMKANTEVHQTSEWPLFYLVVFHLGFGSGGANISQVMVVFTMQYILVRFANVPIRSSRTKGFIREMQVDMVLWLKLLFHGLPASQCGHIDRHMVVKVLVFVAFLIVCPMT